MTKLKKTVLAAVALSVVSGFAYATDIGDWMMDSNVAYIYNSDGRAITVRMNNPNHQMLMRNAHKVPRNTMFFMTNGQLYERTGNWDYMGGPHPR